MWSVATTSFVDYCNGFESFCICFINNNNNNFCIPTLIHLKRVIHVQEFVLAL